MSTFSCPVVDFKIEKHPNADTLSICHIKGWQCIVRTEEFVDEVFGVYIPIDAIADRDHPFLSFLEGKKVKTIRLRKVLSQGILLPFTKVLEYLNKTKGIKLILPGDDLQGPLEIRKYIPPVNNSLGQYFQKAPTDGFSKYTDLEHWKNYVHVFGDPVGVVVTEKLHGTSARYSFINNEFSVGTRQMELHLYDFISGAGDFIEVAPNVWTNVFWKYDVSTFLTKLFHLYKEQQVAIYGEIVGPRVQDLDYGFSEYTFFCYDIKVGNDYIPPLERIDVCKEIGIPHVPVLHTGPWSVDLLNLRTGNSTLTDKHCREGIVIEPIVPTYDSMCGRVKMKVISEEYDQRQGALDFAS